MDNFAQDALAVFWASKAFLLSKGIGCAADSNICQSVLPAIFPFLVQQETLCGVKEEPPT